MFNLDIITRHKTVEKNLEVKEVLIPTELGPTCLLPKHTSMICNMTSGIIKVKGVDKEKKYFITKGVCKILDKNILLLCDICQSPDEIDVKRAESAIAKYQPMVSQKTITSEDYNILYGKLMRATLRLELTKP